MMFSRYRISWVAALLLAALFGGCATHKIDWSARVGAYTFDQAVAEIGPPDKQAKLTDGTLVAEWLTHRGYHQIIATGSGYGYPYGGLPYAPTILDSSSPDFFLRLTFGADGRLQAWKKYAK